MVLCKFFLQGHCRFGAKCYNEHLDLKQLVKSDAESALNGKQWPFSCYGPFKDKPCLPNFIEDQSFEEIRFLCYDAKQKNYFDRFHQQFTKEAQDASNKMKALVQPSTELLSIVLQLHDNNNTIEPQQLTTGALFNNQTTSGGSIFGGGTGGNMLSGNGNSDFAAAAQGASLFGNGAFGSTLQQGSVFGGQANNTMFGGGTTQAYYPQQQQQQAFAGGSIFAQSAAQNTGSFFGSNEPFGQLQTQTQPQQEVGIFAKAAQDLYGAPQQQQQQQTQPQQEMGIFAKAAQDMFGQQTQNTGQFAQVGQQNGNIFAQAMQQQLPNSGGGQQMQSATMTNIFAPALQKDQIQQPPAFNQQIAQMPQQTSMQQTLVVSTIYSKMEDLTPEEIEAFQADFFTPGKVPCVPPPKELIN